MNKINPEQAFYFINKLAFHLITISGESKERHEVREMIKKKHPWFNERIESLVISALESDSFFIFNLVTMHLSDEIKVQLLMDISRISILEVGLSLNSRKLYEFYSDCQTDMDMDYWEIELILFDLMRITEVKRGLFT